MMACFVLGPFFNIPTLGMFPAFHNVSTSDITVSGLSGGAFFAVQFHIAHSSILSGAAAIAGGPYYCAEADLLRAMGACMSAPREIDVQRLVDITQRTAETGTIDSLRHLESDRIYLFSGTRDSVVAPLVAPSWSRITETLSLRPMRSRLSTVFHLSMPL